MVVKFDYDTNEKFLGAEVIGRHAKETSHVVEHFSEDTQERLKALEERGLENLQDWEKKFVGIGIYSGDTRQKIIESLSRQAGLKPDGEYVAQLVNPWSAYNFGHSYWQCYRYKPISEGDRKILSEVVTANIRKQLHEEEQRSLGEKMLREEGLETHFRAIQGMAATLFDTLRELKELKGKKK